MIYRFTIILFALLISSFNAIGQNNNQSKGNGEDVIFSEDFEKWPLTGWTFYSESDPIGFQKHDDKPYAGKHCIAHLDPTDKNCYDWVVTPEITIPEGQKYYFTFMQRNDWTGKFYDFHGVYVSVDGNDPVNGDFEAIHEFSFPQSSWTLEAIDLSAYSGKKIHLAFKYSGKSADQWYIDNVSIKTMTFYEGFESWPPQGWTFKKEGVASNPGWALNTRTRYNGLGCAEHKLSANGNAISYMISPEITVPEYGKFMYAEHNEFMTHYGKHEIFITTGSPELNDDKLVLLKEMSDYTGYAYGIRKFDLNEYAGKKIHIVFKYSGNNKSAWLIDAVTVVKPLDYDLSVLEFTSPNPIIANNTPFICKAKIRNWGSKSIIFNAKMKINDDDYEKSFEINPSEIIDIAFDPIDLAIGEYTFNFEIETIGDAEITFTRPESKFSVAEGVKNKAMAYVIDPYENKTEPGPISLDPFTPQTHDFLEKRSENGTRPLAGAMINHLWYCCYEYSPASIGKAGNTVPTSWEIIDTKNGNTLYCGKSNLTFYDLSYDYTSKTLYGITYNELFKIDPLNNDIKSVGEINNNINMAAFAIDINGNAYAICQDKKLYKVNLDTFIVEEIGDTGIPSVAYIQSMAFDHDSGRLFWCAGGKHGFNTYIVDITTGKASLIGAQCGNAQVTAFDFPYGDEMHALTFITNDKQGKPIPNVQLSVNGIQKSTNNEGEITFFPFLDGDNVEYSYSYNGDEGTSSTPINGNTVVEIASVGTDELSISNIKLYPNPANEFVNIENASGYEISIIDLKGTVLLKENVNTNNHRIQLDSFSEGVYLMNINNGNELSRKKIIIRN
ncbi:MAG: choice-of-anchor J domain-containing protein [Hyphomicrobiales bacterium]